MLAAGRGRHGWRRHYGHDVGDPSGRVFALGALSVGLAEDAGKFVAYRELNSIVQALARRQTGKQLGKNEIANVVHGVYKALGMRVTQARAHGISRARASDSDGLSNDVGRWAERATLRETASGRPGTSSPSPA